MKSALKLYWVGPWIPQQNLEQWKAASPAAMKWQKHLVDALVGQGVAVNWAFYRPEPYWPRGRLLPADANISGYQAPNSDSNELRYINLPVMRRHSLTRSCQDILAAIPQQKQIIVSYNAPEWYSDALCRLRSKFNFSWICIVADDVAPEGPDGYVFLSYGYFERFLETDKKMHLDGGIYPLCKPKNETVGIQKRKKTRFMYSGSLGRWGGIPLLLDALQLVDNDDFEVLISGSGISKADLLRVSRDVRVRYLGLVNETQLADAFSSTDIFLNPRPTRIAGGGNNFPSKILDYLGWEKPIISTWTDGLAPEYRHVLNVVDDNPESLAVEMMKLSKATVNHVRTSEWAFRFNKCWNQQATRLSDFIQLVSRNI